ncbi:ATP-binding protein [Arsenophonus endosymbiont of Crataerina pallida]|uniref:ATP-binding protein n=1 Tax=Arsenophonus endosymbiont of Crataerina pallida TaxID=3066235 RepID=UPI0030CFF11A
MGTATLILGESGTGKSTSLRNLDTSKTLIVQCINKPLPFPTKQWKLRNSANPDGNVYRTDQTDNIVAVLKKAPHEIIVIDDYQAVMVNELMAKCNERGYDKFTSIGKNAWDVFRAAGEGSARRRVYILSHTQTDDFGSVRMKTVGKLVDSTLVPEGYFTIVLRTHVSNGSYSFSTQSNDSDCCKSPMGMFDSQLIENDLNEIDKVICNYYGITPQQEKNKV